MNILIVDDNPMNVMVVQEMLRRSGYEEVTAALSAEEMFRILRSEGAAAKKAPCPSVDLILLDLMMPNMDGIQACRVLQQDEKLKDIPVIMVTAIGDSRKLAEALDAGATDYVTKPINKIELLARIRSALRLKRELDWHRERDLRVREELELARQVQEAVLPNDMDEERFRLRAFFRASEKLAGDLYAWHAFDRNRLIVAVMDAMGHGISSSLISMFAASVLKEAMRTQITPRRVAAEMNRRLLQLQYENELVQYYCTGICAWIDLEHGVMEYVNAGHPPGVILRGDGSADRTLTVTAPPIGLFEEMDIRTESLEIHPGDALHLYTDGLLDLFPGDMDDKREGLTRSIERSGGREQELLELLDRPSLEGRSDDRCLVRLDVKPGGPEA
ncbi:PP2C family protein-serine/threonine phosphatase [Cohnella zeiphila]|uniref:Fused response regulator/phosphatase n=1 Tax=Cohnella zeiphila TaxID=2761120 RepID=A0A7X0VXJ2_9BACL|nr:fused response regulator/phosphatase [Cohnella zeiphila]MBB6731978.1 fused response regulator/phosphatase [Cohnella zeiphila]